MPLNFKNICRLCLSEDVNLMQIFSCDPPLEQYESLSTLPEKIMSCTHIQMSAEDGLPTMVCHRCLYQLDLWFAFKQLSERSDTFLRKQVDNNSSVQNRDGASDLFMLKREVDMEWTLADQESGRAFLEVTQGDGPDQDESPMYEIETNHLQQTFSEDASDSYLVASSGVDEVASINSLQASIGELSYICHVCNRRFESRRAYAVHKSKSHPGVTQPMPESENMLSNSNISGGRRFSGRIAVCHPDRKIRLARRYKRRTIPSSSENTSVPSSGDNATERSSNDSDFVSKRQCCTFCNKHFAKLPRHFETAHSEEPEVLEYLKYPKYSTERADHLTELRNRGNYMHNQTVLSTGKGVVIPARRTPYKESVVYKPCPFCFRFLRRHTLRLHVRRCKRNPHSDRYIGGM